MKYNPLAIPTENSSAASFGFKACDGGVCAADGICAAGISAGFRRNPSRKDLALVCADKTCVCAATFTKNCFCAAPVRVSRANAASGVARAVLLNSGNANAATGDEGVEVARKSAALMAQELGCNENEVLVASTGVIGVPLSFDPFAKGVPQLVAELEHSAKASRDAATAVMTTDTHPKEFALEGEVALPDGTSRVVHVGGFVKGSGMIQPNMATMLAVITTDAPLSSKAAHSALLAAVQSTFNKVTVDSDTSTNDSCFLLATGCAAAGEIEVDSPAFLAMSAAIQEVCEVLARDIAADGEGSTKLITVDVLGAPTQKAADKVARSIANSPLVKTAVFGCDANWGRVAAAAGKCGVAFDQTNVDIDFIGVPVLRAGLPVLVDETEMSHRFAADEIPIAISLGAGIYHSRIWTCDLTHDYVRINGEYRT
jgi:glutamate N-acetyltransferase/amino-acid N-acetyltransferase